MSYLLTFFLYELLKQKLSIHPMLARGRNWAVFEYVILLLMQTTQSKITTCIITHTGLLARKAGVQFRDSRSRENPYSRSSVLVLKSMKQSRWYEWLRPSVHWYLLSPLTGSAMGQALCWRIHFILLRKQILIGPLSQTVSIFYDLSFNCTGNSNVSCVSNWTSWFA